MRTKSKRSKSWTENALKGRIQARINPTKLRLLRDQSFILQETVSKNLKITEPTYGAIETGRRPVNLERAKAIAEFFKKEVDYLFTKVPRKNKYIASKIKNKPL
jgi:DNA-binding XRE family transcriptional regulator